MPGAGYQVRWAGGLPVIAAPSEIDVGNATELRQLLLSCADESQPTLVVDMSETVFCDSTGLHQLVRARKRAVAAGGEVRLVIRSAVVLRLFAVMGIDCWFPVFTSLEEAVADTPARAARPDAATAAPPQAGDSAPAATAG